MNFNAEFRSVEIDDDRFLAGYFVVYDEFTELWNGFFEKIEKRAIDKNLNKDIKCLFNHDTAIVLGRTGNQTVELKSDDKGLFAKVKINKNDSQAMDILARVERGDINSCSFGFSINKEEVKTDENGDTRVSISDLELYEISVVTFPAYASTNVEARKKQIEQDKNASIKNWKVEMKGRLKK